MPIQWEDTAAEPSSEGLIAWAEEPPQKVQTRRGLREPTAQVRELPPSPIQWADEPDSLPSSASRRVRQREKLMEQTQAPKASQDPQDSGLISWQDEAPGVKPSQAPLEPQTAEEFSTGYGAHFAKRGAELMKNVASALGPLAPEGTVEYWKNLEESYNLAPTGTMDAALDEWEKGNYLGAVSQVGGVIGDLAASSAADMLGMAAGPAYVSSILEERARNRAINEGREEALASDKAKVLPLVLAEVGLNFLSAGRTLGASRGLGEVAQTTGQVLKEAGTEAGKAAGREGLTEAGQESLQITAETEGTGKELGAGEIAKRLGTAGVAGMALGGPMGFGSSVYNQSMEMRRAADLVDEANVQRRVADFLARRELEGINIELAEDLRDPTAENFVGPLPEGFHRRKFEALEGWTLSELELEGQTPEPLVRGPDGDPGPVSRAYQGPRHAQTQTRPKTGKGPLDSHDLAALQYQANATKEVFPGVYAPAGASPMLRKASQIIGELKQVFRPGMVALLGDPASDFGNTKHIASNQGVIIGDKTSAQLFRINPGRIKALALKNNVSEDVVLVNVLAHEFGHGVIKEMYSSMPKAVRVALLNDYRRWLRQPERYSTKDFWRDRVSNILEPGAPALLAQRVQEGAGLNWDYWGSFHEFIAEQMARYVTRGLVGKTGVLEPGPGSFLGKTAGELSQAYKKMIEVSPKYKKEFPSVNNFFDSLRYGVLKDRPSPTTDSTGLVEPEGLIEPSITESLMINIAEDAMLEPEEKETLRTIGRETARFNTFIKYALTLPQIERENSHIQGVSEFVEGVRKWWAEKNRWLDQANETLREARRLKVEQRKEVLKKFEKFVFRLTEESHLKGRKLKAEELQRIIQETRVSPEGVQLYERMSQDFQMALNKLETSLIKDARLKLRADPLALEKRINEIQKDFKTLRDKDYFPLSRFGKYSVTAKDEKGNVVYFALWESERDAERDYTRRKKDPNLRVSTRLMDDRARTLVDMPRALIERMKEISVEEFISNNPGVSETDIAKYRADIEKEFAVAELDYSPGQKYLNRMKERRFVPGFSEDALRSYAHYMQSFANYIARLEHSHEMLFGLDDIGRYAAALGARGEVSGAEVRKIDRLQQALRDHYQYLMNPGNEWAGLRSFGAHWFLGFSPRAALVNFIQVPTASYSWLAARYNDVKAVKELGRAMKDLRSAWGRGKDGAIERDLGESLDLGFEGGFLNESLPTELGIYSEGGNLKRALPAWIPKGRQANYALKQYMHWSMAMFQGVEKINRLVTFTAAYRLARDAELEARGLRSMDEAFNQSNDIYEDIRDKAFRSGREAIETTQGEYARWARPRGMQGKKSAMFLFKLYMQHMAYFIARDPGRMRFLAMQLAVAGLIGLPGAEGLMALVEAILKQFPEYENKKPDVQQFVREEVGDFARALDMAPDLLLHGAGRYGFGALYPFDLSPSLSLGNIVPGVDVLSAQRPGENVYEKAGRMAEVVGGPLASVAFNMWKGLSSDELNEWKQSERLMPKYMVGLSKAARWAFEGEEQGFKGETLVEFDVHDPGQALEILGTAMGMNPRRVAEKREQSWAVRQSEQFYAARSQYLLRQYWEAVESEDREARSDVLEAIRRYNKEVPFGELGISSQQLRRSIKNRLESREKANRELPQSRKYKRLQDDVLDSFRGREESAP